MPYPTSYLAILLTVLSWSFETLLLADIYSPTSYSITATNNYPQLGETVTFTAPTFPGFSYTWLLEGDANWSVGGPQYARRMERPGPLNAYLTIRDAAGQVYFNEGYRVNVLPQILASNNTPTLGETVTFSVAPYSEAVYYFWLLEGEANWSVGGPVFVRQMPRVGSITVYLIVKNAWGQEYFNGNRQVSILAQTQPTLPPTSTPTNTPSTTPGTGTDLGPTSESYNRNRDPVYH